MVKSKAKLLASAPIFVADISGSNLCQCPMILDRISIIRMTYVDTTEIAERNNEVIVVIAGS